MKIRHLKYKEIDFDKYDNCIEHAFNSRVYAYSWYLDIVTNKNWEILVLDDYKAVMPLPFKRVKRQFFKKMIVQPLFCQQLGVFSLSELVTDTFQLFIKIFNTFTIYTYNFNSENTNLLENKKCIIKKNNFELHLDKEYSVLKKEYTKGLKSNINKGLKSELTVKKGLDFTLFKKIKKENGFYKTKEREFIKMQNLTKKIIDNSKGDFYAVFKDHELVAVSFLIQTNNRIIYLLSSTSSVGRITGATSFLLNHIIENNSNKNVIFDFEGSMISGLSKFFRSFGAKNNAYIEYTQTK